MRVVIVTESFPPDVNGVAHCALQTAAHLAARGHEPLVIAPAAPEAAAAEACAPCPAVRVPSLPLPGYPQVRLALPSRRLAAALAAQRAELVHLASPFVLGVRGMAAASRLGIPAVAVYQTDLAGYARTYMGAGEATARRRLRAVHSAADLTLAPSTAAVRDLVEHGIPRVRLWSRGVDAERFGPWRRDAALRRRLAPDGELLVGSSCARGSPSRSVLAPPWTRWPRSAVAGCAPRSWWHRARGTSLGLDLGTAHAVASALSALPGPRAV
jgi:phosphatidylinositol alpha 1,6-mannosyltransferase